VKYLYNNIIVFFTARSVSLGRGPPEEKPVTSEPLPGRLKELLARMGEMEIVSSEGGKDNG